MTESGGPKTDRAALDERLDDAAARLSGVTVSRSGDEATWSAAGRPIAVLCADGVEFHLDAAVAAAAARTPDATLSPRGAEWIRFRPSTLDRHAIDRLEAWFSFAYRHASPAPDSETRRAG